MLAQPASASAPARTRPPAMKCLWCERVVILLLPVLTIGIETPRRGVSIRPADDARICCRFQGHSRIFAGRSEEHTSELQSLMRISFAVFFFKKTKTTYKHTHTITNINNKNIYIH